MSRHLDLFPKLPSILWLILLLISCSFYITKVEARPLVRHIRSTHEFDRLLQKHATETGLPVVVDFYSDGCGPCRMIAPVFQQVAKEYLNKAVFVKVDVNAMYELSSRYQVRSMPTFLFFYNGKQVNQFSGAGEQQLRHFTKDVVDLSTSENVLLFKDSLVNFYKDVDPSKAIKDIETVYQKCADFNKGKYNDKKECFGNAASKLVKSLKTKYGKGPKLDVRFTPNTSSDDEEESSAKKKPTSSSSSSQTQAKANLPLATLQELLDEIEKRKDAEEDQLVEEEADDNDEFAHSWSPGDFPERVTIIGGGPAGMSAAIYAARAGLTPVVIAPPMGGQLQGKGVDVENYPGLTNMTGPGVVASMRNQAAMYGAVFEVDSVTHIDTSKRPFKVYTNSSVITTHSIIVATGAESRWLNIPGEYEMRGTGVSSCATCDGAAFYKKDVIVVGGGDSAMEEALVLARTSKSVTIIHRRDEFRASKVLAKRVLEHPNIKVIWNATVAEILGDFVQGKDEVDEVESVAVDTGKQIVTGILLRYNQDSELTKLKCDAVFVAIGHDPNTSFLKEIVEFEDGHPGYIKTNGKSTKTSVPGIFAAGDVSDAIYRQAITSAGSGAAAALDAERWLSEHNLGNEAAELEAELLAEMLDNTRQSPSDEYNVYNEERAYLVKGTKESARGEL